MRGMRGLVGAMLLAVVLAVGLGSSPAAAALTCRTVGEQRVCLESVKRSAKYFWQYQAVVSVDGTALPLQAYDCRQAPAVQPTLATTPTADDGTALTPDFAELSAADLHQWVCRAVQPRR